ncbi:MAG TPA: hypothetical protein VGA38_07265 [Candidatus Limnocylindria bacterium]
MAARNDIPRSRDDTETAERKSKTIDERVPERQDPDVVPEVVLPGSAGAFVPQAGIGREGPLGEDALSEGEIALEQERKAQRAHITRG